MLKLSIIGSGNVAKTIGYLLHQTASVEIVDVVNRSQQSADESVAFIGSGKAIYDLSEIRPADIFIIGCGDDHIENCLTELLEQKIVQANNIVFHFSGAKNSAVLHKAKAIGAKCASLHPVKSFADPTQAIETFADTYCGLEGDDKALNVLKELIENIGGQHFKVDAENKLIYHAASVFASNYLVALQELSIRAFAKSGVERELAIKILQPIVNETTNNIFTLGTANALTGPIARGDHNLVSEQLKALTAWDGNSANIYQSLGKIAADLSEQKGTSDKADLDCIRNILK